MREKIKFSIASHEPCNFDVNEQIRTKLESVKEVTVHELHVESNARLDQFIVDIDLEDSSEEKNNWLMDTIALCNSVEDGLSEKDVMIISLSIIDTAVNVALLEC
jgi:hypothetical protein